MKIFSQVFPPSVVFDQRLHKCFPVATRVSFDKSLRLSLKLELWAFIFIHGTIE